MLDFSTLLVAGIPLTVVVFGLVEMVKSLGLTGRGCTAASMLIGLALGISYQVAQNGAPAGFGGWFSVVIFGLVLGLVASGFYKWGEARLPEIRE